MFPLQMKNNNWGLCVTCAKMHSSTFLSIPQKYFTLYIYLNFFITEILQIYIDRNKIIVVFSFIIVVFRNTELCIQ